jgi:hypothetical protein
MAYLPKNKYKVLYTKGNTFKLQSTGKPYTGDYIKLNDGRLFAGNNPNDLGGKLLPIIEYKNKSILLNERNNRVYQLLDKQRAEEQDSYIPIPSSKPIPTPEQYLNKEFKRYISVRLNTKEYQEISKDTYDNFNKRPYNKFLNKAFFIPWSLAEDNADKNTIRLTNLEQNLPGIFNFFPNKGEYGIKNGAIRINPTTRIYPDGENIDKNLPAAYQLGNSNPNSIENLDVPKYQFCGNCVFHQKGYCNKWEAKIRHKFWCKAFQGKVNKSVEMGSEDMVSSPPPEQQQTPSPGGGSY